MIKPTVGRAVWFHPQHDKNLTEAAIVCYVDTDRLVNLVVFNNFGNIYSRPGITLRQEGDPEPEGDYCEWMPYQIGQAKKQANEDVSC